MTGMRVAAVFMLLMICSLAAPFHRGDTAAAAASAQVAIVNFAFSPATLKVAIGTTVVWTNKDSTAHTVTSDNNAWTDSGSIDQNKTFSHTFSKAGTYPYHCSIHPTMTAMVVVGGGASSGGMSAMGPGKTISRMAWTGYYDGHAVTYISTDSSSKTEAARDHINYAPSLAKALPMAGKIFLIANGAFAGRGPVFDSEPGEAGYTPLWQEMRVSWNNASKAVAVGSDTQIAALAAKGAIRVTATGVVLNCPIVVIAAMHM